MVNTRNILLFGITGKGKSTLANVLLNKNNNFEEVFETSDSCASATKEVQIEKFSEEGINYRLIDTVGMLDTSLSQEELINKITEATATVKDGLSQILLVYDGRFGDYDTETYNLLIKIIFNSEVVPYITIVRTRFVNFENEEKCQQEKQAMANEANVRPDIAKIFREVKTIAVDNPPIAEEESEEENETEWKKRKRMMSKVVREKRAKSREKLLKHLATCQTTYYPANKDNLKEQIDKFLTERKLRREKEQQKLKDWWGSEERLKEIEEREKKELERLRKELAELEEKKKLKEELAEEKRKSEEQLNKQNKNRGLENILVSSGIGVVIVLLGWWLIRRFR